MANENSNIHHAIKIPLVESFVLEQLSKEYWFDIGWFTAFPGLPLLTSVKSNGELWVAVPNGVRFSSNQTE